MKHLATSQFWAHYRQLPGEIRQLADKNFKLLKHHPLHPSLHLKQIEHFWSSEWG